MLKMCHQYTIVCVSKGKGKRKGEREMGEEERKGESGGERKSTEGGREGREEERASDLHCTFIFLSLVKTLMS